MIHILTVRGFLDASPHMPQHRRFIPACPWYPDARLHIVYLGSGDIRHSVELIQYLNPAGKAAAMPERHRVGASHLGVIVDDLDAFHAELSGRGVRFASPPAIRPGAVTPWPAKAVTRRTPTATGWSFWSGRLRLRALRRPDALRPGSAHARPP